MAGDEVSGILGDFILCCPCDESLDGGSADQHKGEAANALDKRVNPLEGDAHLE